MKKKLIVFFIFMVFGFVTYGQIFNDNFSAEPDIDTLVKNEEGIIIFKFSLENNYHITDLKYNFFKIELKENEYLMIIKTVFPIGVPYGDEMVFQGNFDVSVYVKQLKEIVEPVNLKFKVSFQICQERPVELCYAPTSKDVDIKISQNIREEDRGKSEDVSFSQWVDQIIKEELKKKSVLLFLLIFVAGFLTSLTPCVYPVIPIVMGYIGSRSGKNKLKGFYLSIFFVLGLSFVYSVFGVIAATTGTMIGLSFQNPLVVIIISAIFFIMGLSLAGFFEIPVPSSISSKMQSGHGSKVIGSFIMGGISGIIAAPCVGPVLIALLSWISQTGNVLLGFWLTFTFSLGLGVIFLIVGTFSGIISTMPKGGNWMNYIKYFFSLLLMGSGIYFITYITAEWLTYLLWGTFFIAAAVFMGLFKPIKENEDLKSKVFKVTLVLFFLTGAFLFVKSLEMKYFPVKYSTAGEEKTQLPWISDLDEGKATAKAENKIMMIDTYADWCAACKELEKYTFSTPEVSERLKEFVLVKLDFTKKNKGNEEMRKSLNIIGMPTIIFFNSGGTEIKRFSGFMKKDKFLKLIESLK